MSGGSTAIEFAYAVHTDIGHHCRACRINRRLAPLSVPLESGQTVEILTEKVPQTCLPAKLCRNAWQEIVFVII